MAASASAWYGPAALVAERTTTPGGTVTVKGTSFDHDDLVKVRLDGLNGPIVGTFTPTSGKFEGPMNVPGDVTLGSHTLVFAQYDAGGALEEMPPRALLQVHAPSGGSPLLAAPLAADTAARATALEVTKRHPVGLGALVLVALGAAVVTGSAAGIAVAAVRSNGGATETGGAQVA